jgi:hypothetical protein
MTTVLEKDEAHRLIDRMPQVPFCPCVTLNLSIFSMQLP